VDAAGARALELEGQLERALREHVLLLGQQAEQHAQELERERDAAARRADESIAETERQAREREAALQVHLEAAKARALELEGQLERALREHVLVLQQQHAQMLERERDAAARGAAERAAELERRALERDTAALQWRADAAEARALELERRLDRAQLAADAPGDTGLVAQALL
jgi:hypothetical protein